jgi:hypothetical protein
LSKGSVTDSKTIIMTVNVPFDPILAGFITIPSTYSSNPPDPVYTTRTLTDNTTNVSVTGNFREESNIVVVKSTDGSYNISVTPQNGFKGELTISFDLGAKNNGRLYTVIHTTESGQRQIFFVRCVNSNVSVTVTELSPFEIIKGFKAEYWENPFTDVSQDQWYYTGVGYTEVLGLMDGTGDGLFEPDTKVNRAMLVTILYRMEGEPAVTTVNHFTDLAGSTWYTDAVIWAAESKIISGYGDGSFGPLDTLTREQMVTIIYRYAVYKGYDVSVDKDTNILSYKDAFDVSEYAMFAIQWACRTSIIQGIGGGRLNPQGNSNRAQIASVIQRFCEDTAK